MNILNHVCDPDRPCDTRERQSDPVHWYFELIYLGRISIHLAFLVADHARISRIASSSSRPPPSSFIHSRVHPLSRFFARPSVPSRLVARPFVPFAHSRMYLLSFIHPFSRPSALSRGVSPPEREVRRLPGQELAERRFIA